MSDLWVAPDMMRVIEQLEGIYLNASVWESSVFPARVRDYQPSMLDELLASGDVVWVGSKINGSNAKEAGGIAFHPADSRLLTKPGEQSQNTELVHSLKFCIFHQVK